MIDLKTNGRVAQYLGNNGLPMMWSMRNISGSTGARSGFGKRLRGAGAVCVNADTGERLHEPPVGDRIALSGR